MKLKGVAFLLISFICFTLGNYINKPIQIFRQDYRKFRSRSLKAVDNSFLTVYNRLNSSITEYAAPFHQANLRWKKVCKNLQNLKLEENTRMDWSRISRDVTKLFVAISFIQESGLSMLFSPYELTSPTASAIILNNLFDRMEEQMDVMWDIYMKNKSCVAEYFSLYLTSFEPLIENICWTSNKTMENLMQDFERAEIDNNFANKTIDSCVKMAESCSEPNEVDDCLEKFVIFYFIEFFNHFTKSLSEKPLHRQFT